MSNHIDLITFFLFLALVVVAICFNIGRSGRTVKNPKRHHAADESYVVLYYHNNPCAFTTEAINEAMGRAQKLNID